MNEGDVPGAASGNGEGVAGNGDDGWNVMIVKCGGDVGRGGWGVGRASRMRGSREPRRATGGSPVCGRRYGLRRLTATAPRSAAADEDGQLNKDKA